MEKFQKRQKDLHKQKRAMKHPKSDIEKRMEKNRNNRQKNKKK